MTIHSNEGGTQRVPTSKFPDAFFDYPLFPFLALLRVNDVGPITYFRCLESLCAKGVEFFCDDALHVELGLRESIRSDFKNLYRDLQKPESYETNEVICGVIQDLVWESQENNYILLITSDDFPHQLKEIYDCPPILFVRGNVSLLKSRQLAMVGSRRPTREGGINARAFAQHLAEQGWVITSGLASGIDTFSHEGALLAGEQSTIAVLAHGLDAVYPKRNQQLAKNILENNGTLVSEFPIAVDPKPEFFPRRNRIISGLSSGVLVVEAACKSGSLITAYSALEQNRDVFAIPGSIHNPMAKGCHELIRQGATLVQSSQDINEHYLWHVSNNKKEKKPKTKKEKLTKQESRLLKALQHEELTANEIAALLGLPIHEISSLLTLMEMKGLVIQGHRGFLKQH